LDRNTVLAFALSMIVFVTYVMYQEERRMEQALEANALEAVAQGEAAGMPANPAPGVPNSAPVLESTKADPDAAARPVWPAPSAKQIEPHVTTLANGDVIARITNGPGLIESWRLESFKERLPEGEVPIELVDSESALFGVDVAGLGGSSFADRRFEVVQESKRAVVQRLSLPSGALERTLRLDPEGYGFDLELRFLSQRADPVDASFVVEVPAQVSQRPDFREVSLLAYREEEGTTRELISGIGRAGFFDFGATPSPIIPVEGRSRWAGFDAQFFGGFVIDPEDRGRLNVDFEAVEVGERARVIARLPSRSVGSGGELEAALRGFLGPKTGAALATANADLEQSVDRGWSWLEPLTLFFELALDWLYEFIPNYGWCIIVLTILVRLVTAPLMVRQMRSAERMREVQPKIKALQERYADDRQKQSEEMMKLYREEQINPLGGCLPLLLQMPVLIGLFYALRTSIGLRHAPWILWIDDLSQPATLFTIPGLDFPVRVLPLIMGASMFAQQKMMPQTGMDPVQARMMLIMMPGMMLLISYTFPSGLVLYWTVSNLLGIAHQYWVRNHLQR